MAQATITESEKYRLIATQVTLDGKPAMVCGALLDYPIVATSDGKQRIEFSWSAVKHVVDNCNGQFKS